jgi:uncharacterized surface protein with fasciclin (FAS1) repeats
MQRAATAGFVAGIAMMIGGALGAVSGSDPAPKALLDTAIMNPMVGGQTMLPQRDIVDNLAASPMHTRMAQALKDTDMVSALRADGQFTVFAPTNAAFAQAGHMSHAELARRLSYLIVPGSYDSTTLLRMINEKGGDVHLRTAEGGTLIAKMNGPTNIMLMDENGNVADIAIYDIHDKNGVIQVIDKVLSPKTGAHRVASNESPAG